MNEEFQFNIPIQFENIENKHGEYITVNLFGASAATLANYGVFFGAKYACEVLQISEWHETAGGANALLQVEKLSNGVAKGGGANLLVTPFDLNATPDTEQRKEMFDFNRSTKSTILNIGDRLALKHNNVGLAGTAGVHLTIYLKPLGRGHYR